MEYTRISDLRGNMDNVSVKVRVLEAGEATVINTKNGPRTISEAIVGDESGRVKLTLWGKAAGTIKKGDVIEIKGGWTTVFRGQVQLNVGVKGTIVKLDNSEAPAEEDIPESTPAQQEERRGEGERRSFRGYGRFGRRR